MTNTIVAGIHLGGGKKEDFSICLLEYFGKDRRWFVTDLIDVTAAKKLKEGNDFFIEVLRQKKVKYAISSLPLTPPPCFTCTLRCPGQEKCIDPGTMKIRQEIDEFLLSDDKKRKSSPRKYANERLEEKNLKRLKNVKKTNDHFLSKQLKKKMKAGFSPYRHRYLDYYLWQQYHDLLMNYFGYSYESYGSVGSSLFFRMNYLQRHLKNIKMMEGHVNIYLLELYMANMISKKDLMDYRDFDNRALASHSILKKIEKKYNLFIYRKDYHDIFQENKFFQAFILSLAGLDFCSKQTGVKFSNSILKKDRFYISQNTK